MGSKRNRLNCWAFIVAGLLLLLGLEGHSVTALAGFASPPAFFDDENPPEKKKGSRKEKKESGKEGKGGDKEKEGDDKKKDEAKSDEKETASETKPVIRWGQRRNETDAEYDARFAKLLKRIKQPKQGDWSGGRFYNAKNEEIRMWSNGDKSMPFICRSDISRQFTAELVMYMEMLHREYGEALLIATGTPARVREPIEVIVFGDQGTYLRAGGRPGTGGYFTWAPNLSNDRSPYWPAKHFRLTQFTSGVTDFSKWEKSVLRHEGAHMELQLRMGFTLLPGGLGYAITPPIWVTEGIATVFEYWDLRKTVEENFAEIPNRGRYAGFIRRTYGTPMWGDFSYLWHLNIRTWNAANTWFNYCEAWSFAGYLFGGGPKGHRDFRKILDVAKRVGDNSRSITVNREVVESRAWNEAFSDEYQTEMQANWYKWIESNLPRGKAVVDEEFHLRRQGINPKITDSLQRFTEEEMKENIKWVEKEEARRKKINAVEW